MKQVATEDLRRKVVALFITSLDPDIIHGSEYAILREAYIEKRHNLTRAESQYEVVWVPIGDYWGDDKYRLFENLREQMEWHSIHHPSVVSPVVIRYIKEKWNFHKKPMVVFMDTQGKIVHHNAIHMMCIWGSSRASKPDNEFYVDIDDDCKLYYHNSSNQKVVSQLTQLFDIFLNFHWELFVHFVYFTFSFQSFSCLLWDF